MAFSLFGEQLRPVSRSRSHAPAWECIPASPLLTNLQQPVHALIISCAGITPMLRVINIPPFYRISVNILNLLPHHLFICYQFRMYAFLPELVSSICFMRFFIKSQLFQNSCHTVFIKIMEQFFGCIRFETCNILIQLPALRNEMQVIFKDDVCVDSHSILDQKT